MTRAVFGKLLMYQALLFAFSARIVLGPELKRSRGNARLADAVPGPARPPARVQPVRAAGLLQLQPKPFNLLVDLMKNDLVQSLPRKSIPKSADRALIRRILSKVKSREHHEVYPHPERFFHLLIRKTMPFLQQYRFQHLLMVIGLLPTLGIYIVLVYPYQVLAYPRPVDQSVQLHQLVALELLICPDHEK